MYRVMVVDDEPIVLESLMTFPWESCGCCMDAGAWADNGADGLKLLMEKKPDIVISDIRMPVMNGLEFAEKVREYFPETEIILLTGYAEFEYAKKAITIGVREYLLKPFRFEDVEKALKSCIQELEEKKARRQKASQIEERLRAISPMLTSQIYQDLLEGRIGDYTDKVEACNIQKARYVVISTQRDPGGSGTLDIALYALIKELVEGMEREFYLAQGIDIISCVLCFDIGHDNSFCEQVALNFCCLLQKAVQDELGFGISFGISLPNEDIFMLHQLKKQSVHAMNYRRSLGNSSIMLYSDIHRDAGHDVFNLTIYEKRIQKCVVQNLGKELDDTYQEMLQDLLQAARGDFSYVRKTLINLVILTFRFAETAVTGNSGSYNKIEELFRCESIEKLSENGRKILRSLITPEPVSFGNGIAERVKDYILQHMQEDVSLDMLSQNLNYSTAYLSRLIKKATGQTFSDLLQEMRLKKAKELLKFSDEKIAVVAARVGYNDISYFTSIFKKKAGVTPSEYRSLSKLENL